jgi:hypothetical protein
MLDTFRRYRVAQTYQTLAQRIWTSRLYRLALFGTATFVSVLFTGYYFGTFDQAIHIPFLKKDVYPGLFPNDPFFDLRFTHYSFFWFPFLYIYRAGLLEPAMFAMNSAKRCSTIRSPGC